MDATADLAATATATAPEPIVLLVTGLSGAGRSLTLKALEDLGFEAVDNLPLSLLERVVPAGPGGQRPLAIGVDSRTRDFDVARFHELVALLKQRRDLRVRLLFLDCDDEILRRRYTETRRVHPLAGDRPVGDGIRAERALLAPLRAGAHVVIDTSALQPGQLKQMLRGHFGAGAGAGGLRLIVLSFSYRCGLPREADLVIDVRFLENPHYDPALRALTGLDSAVARHIEADSGFQSFFASLAAMLEPLLPRYANEGKSYLTIAIGCTGGRHRSVFVAERLANRLAGHGRSVTVLHRDLTEPAASTTTG